MNKKHLDWWKSLNDSNKEKMKVNYYKFYKSEVTIDLSDGEINVIYQRAMFDCFKGLVSGGEFETLPPKRPML